MVNLASNALQTGAISYQLRSNKRLHRRTIGKRLRTQRVPHGVSCSTGKHPSARPTAMVSPAPMGVTRQRQPLAHMARDSVREIATADIGKQTNRGLGMAILVRPVTTRAAPHPG